jgi:hypothetical protein
MAVLGDWQLTLVTVAYFGSAIAAVLGIIALRKARSRQSELARLREEVARLSKDVKHLVDAEQRRFLKELKSPEKEEAPGPPPG